MVAIFFDERCVKSLSRQANESCEKLTSHSTAEDPRKTKGNPMNISGKSMNLRERKRFSV